MLEVLNVALSGAASATDHGMTLDLTGVTIDVTNASTDLTLNGLLTGPGALTQTGPGTLTLANPNTYAGGTYLSNGVLALGGNNANNNGTGSGVGATNNPVTFNGGTLQLYGYGLSSGNNYNSFYNPLVVPAGQPGTLVMFPRGVVNTGAGAGINCSLSGGGTLNLKVNYVRDALSGNWSAFTGLINVSDANAGGDEFRINNTYGYSNAAIYLNGTVIMDSALMQNATINIGELGGVNGTVIGTGTASESGPTWCVGWKNTTNTFSGLIEDDTSQAGFHTSIVKVGTGAWFLGNQDTFSGSTIISNGVLGLTNIGFGDASIQDCSNITIEVGAVLDVSGDQNPTLYLASSQVLSGNGTITGSFDTTQGGTVAPGGGFGGGIGTLTVSNDINLGGTVEMKINRASSPKSDRLVSSQSYINYGGTLLVNNIGPDLRVGDSFTLFNASGGAYHNSFSLIVLPSSDYYTWNTSQLAVDGTISVASVSLPSISSVNYGSFHSGSITINATNGLPNGPVSVLTTTNPALPVSSWTVVASSTFDGSGNLSLPITVNPALPESFFVLQAQ